MTKFTGTSNAEISSFVLEPANGYTDGSAFVRVDGGKNYCYFSRAELKKLIGAAQKIYDDSVLALPKADAYKARYAGHDIYFAELPHKPGYYAGGQQAELAIKNAKLARGVLLDLKYWINTYGPVITPIYLTKREVTDITEGEPITF